MIRRQCALELGVVIPPIRIRDNMQLPPNLYVLKLKGIPLSKGEIMMGHYLAMGGEGDLPGIPTREPAFGLPAIWINETVRTQAEMAGYTVVDPPSVLATHLTEFLKNNAAEIMSRQDVKYLLDNLKKEHPTVIEEVVPGILSLAEVHRVLANLLKERVPIRDLITIMETLGDWGMLTKDTDLLTEYVRQKLAPQFGQLYGDEEGRIYCVTLDPQVEEAVSSAIKPGEHGSYLAIDPTLAQTIIRSLASCLEKSGMPGQQIVLLTSPVIRAHMRRLVERVSPSLPVLSYNEIPSYMQIESVGMVKI